jgi:hypothetical protein
VFVLVSGVPHFGVSPIQCSTIIERGRERSSASLAKHTVITRVFSLCPFLLVVRDRGFAENAEGRRFRVHERSIPDAQRGARRLTNFLSSAGERADVDMSQRLLRKLALGVGKARNCLKAALPSGVEK